MQGTIFDIQRFSVHDGPGIRTTVFMKGCPLRCAWCHNPEGLSPSVEAQFFEEECVHCGRCGGRHERDTVEKCPVGALKCCGRTIGKEELIRLVLKDRDFYGNDGGVTFSGGECLLQADFLMPVMRELQETGIHIAVDTCGSVPWEQMEKTLPYADLYLYDIKCADPGRHRTYTGRDNRLILENLHRLSGTGKVLWIRVPVIPGVNDNEEEMSAIVRIVADSRNAVERVTLMPYHTLGKSKYRTLGKEPPYHAPYMIEPSKLESYKNLFRRAGLHAD